MREVRTAHLRRLLEENIQVRERAYESHQTVMQHELALLQTKLATEIEVLHIEKSIL